MAPRGLFLNTPSSAMTRWHLSLGVEAAVSRTGQAERLRVLCAALETPKERSAWR